jgi:hypothetical protein
MMEIDKQTAKRLYDESPDWFQNQLKREFGEDLFKKREYENIKTFEDACRYCGTTEAEFNKKLTDLCLDADTISFEKLKIVNRAINQGWAPDYTNTNQRKWFPYFVLSSGFGFSDSNYYCDRTAASVGSRLCFETEEQASYSGRQFIDLWRAFITNKN